MKIIAGSALVSRHGPVYGGVVRQPAFDHDAASCVEASLSLDRPTRWLIQQGLRNEGFDPARRTGCSASGRVRRFGAGRRHVVCRRRGTWARPEQAVCRPERPAWP